MDDTESLDMNTMLEVMKVIDCLEVVVARLKRLGSNPSLVETLSLEALEHLPWGTFLPKSGSQPLSSPAPRHRPIGMDLEDAGAECRYCAARLNEILKKWVDAAEGSREY